MKKLKFIHTADWHSDSDPNKLGKLEESLKQMLEYVKENNITAIIHAGDIWEKPQIDPFFDSRKGDGVDLVKNYLMRFSKYVDFIFITKGNNSHDPVGSVKKLNQLKHNIYAYEYPVVLGWQSEIGQMVDLLREEYSDQFKDPDYIVSLVPYPSKSGFITNTSIDNNNAEFLEKFEQVFELIGDVTQPYTCPKILAFHGNVVGSRLSTGQTLVSQDIMVAPKTIEKANHDYYGLGHIHLHQEIRSNMIYSGSIYNKNWGETEQKSFEVIQFSHWGNYGGELEGRLSFYPHLLTSARPMIKLEGFYEEGLFLNDEVGSLFGIPLVENAEYRIRVDVKENDRKLITDQEIANLEAHFNSDAKIEFNVIPDERESRSEQIMKCKTLLDEVIEYAKVVDYDLPESAKQKVLSLTEKEVMV